MKVILMTAVGEPQVLEFKDIPDPPLHSPTALKVRLKAAGINPIDTKLRQRGVFFENALPAILGCDGAGVVIETGSAVTRFQIGDAVWFCYGGLGGDAGNYAEYIVIDETIAQHKPASLSFIEAAAAPLILITAWEALFDRARLGPGKTILIHAGAGGVGHVAIQLAKHAGARVLTTVSTPDKVEFTYVLGADECIAYHEQDFVEAVIDLTEGRGADVVLDTVGGETFHRSAEATAFYGDLVTLLDPGEGPGYKTARNRNLRIGYELMLTPQLCALPQALAHQGEILRQCAARIDEQILKVAIGKVFPLAQAARAHALLEAGHVQGKLVLDIET